MTNSERYEKYIEEHCKKCLNKNTDLCEIRIFSLNDITTTKCVYYKTAKKKDKSKSGGKT